MKNRKIIFKILIILLLVLVLANNICFAKIETTDVKISDKYKNDFNNAGNKILGIVEVVAIIASVIALMIIGIRYMTGSVEEKADYKKTLPYYLIGMVLVAGILPLIELIYNFIQDVF